MSSAKAKLIFMSWLQGSLPIRIQDFSKRRPLGKTAYTMRVKNVIKTQKAQTVAKSYARRFRTACQQVVKRKGAAADN